MFKTGIYVSIAILALYVIWFVITVAGITDVSFTFEETYDFTVVAELCIALCCLLHDITSGVRLIDIALAGAALSSVVLRFVSTDCDGCPDSTSCDHNGCDSDTFRSLTKSALYLLPVAMAVFRVYKAYLPKFNPKEQKLPISVKNDKNDNKNSPGNIFIAPDGQ